MLDFAHPNVYYETLETYFVIELEKMLLVSRTLGTGGLEYAQTSKLDQAGFFLEPSVRSCDFWVSYILAFVPVTS